MGTRTLRHGLHFPASLVIWGSHMTKTQPQDVKESALVGQLLKGKVVCSRHYFPLTDSLELV